MKPALIALALVSLLPASTALARDHDCTLEGLQFSCCDAPVLWSSRVDPRDTRLAITTEDGGATLFLTDDRLGIQLSDLTMRDVRRHLRDVEDEDDNALARAIKTVVVSTVRSVLDHSAECRIRDLDDVAYRDGRLVITSEKGDRVFDHVDVHDEDLLESFSERDAQAFVREFHRLKTRGR